MKDDSEDFDIVGQILKVIKKYPFGFLTSMFGGVSSLVGILAACFAVLMPVLAVFLFFNSGDVSPYDIALDDERDLKCLEEFGIDDPNSSAGKTTLEYCRTLYDVQEEYIEKLGVKISPTMITATLFYGRFYDDYTNNLECDNENPEECEEAEIVTESNFSSWFNDPDYNIKAKKYIKTLASYMLLKTVTTSQCGDKASFVSTPETIKDLAFYTWSPLEELSQIFTVKNGASLRTEKRVVLYTGNPTDPRSCPYEDDAPKYINKYTNSQAYSILSSAYQNAFNICNNDSSTTDCARAEQQYQNSQKWYDTWEAMGIRNNPIGSGSVTFECQYNSTTHHYKSNYYKYAGCAEFPEEVHRYSVDYRYQGLYYYKLMAPMDGFFVFSKSSDSFISKYYDYIVKDIDGNTVEGSVEKTVEEIYMLYETITDGEDALESGSGTSSSAVGGDFERWSQKDPAWSGILLSGGICYDNGSPKSGVGCGTSIYNIGCAATSLAIQVARSGTMVNVDGELNPGSFVQALQSKGGFLSNGAISNWSKVTLVAPNFHLLSYVHNPSVYDIANYVNQGLYVILKVLEPNSYSSEQHWVAVSRVENGEVYIYDPVNTKGEEPLSSGGWGNRYGLYRAVVYENRM